MYCSNCGKKLSEDDFFCSNCGTPVLRQDLFNDNNDNYSDDAFEETRLFTAEELGQFLNDQPDDESYVAPMTSEAQSFNYEPAQIFEKEQQVPQSQVSPSSQSEQMVSNKGTDAKEKMSSAINSANAFVGKFKAHRSEAKAKKAEKKQSVASTEAVNYEESTVTENTSNSPVSLKKIVVPVIILGLIIGLVFGLILVQPWNNGDNTEDTTTGTVIVTEQFTKM